MIKVKVIRVPLEFYEHIRNYKINELRMPEFPDAQAIRLMMNERKIEFPKLGEIEFPKLGDYKQLKKKRLTFDMNYKF